MPALLRTRAPATFVAELRDGWREVRSRTWLWMMMLRAMLVLFVTIAPLQVLGPLALTASTEQPPALWGLMVGLFSLGMLCGGLIALYYRPRRPMVTVALCGTTASVPMIALALQLSPAGLVAVWFARGVAIGVSRRGLGRHPAARDRARVDGPSEQLGLDDGRRPVALGLVLAGPIAQLMGVTDALWLSAVPGPRPARSGSCWSRTCGGCGRRPRRRPPRRPAAP